MDSYPVVFDVVRPERWDRMQVLLRLAILLLLGFVHASLGWLFCGFYLILPIVAAVLVSQRGPDGYLRDSGGSMVRVLRGWNALIAYMSFLIDRFPTDDETLARAIRFDVTPTGSPTVGRALLRLLTSLPELLVVAVLAWIGGFVWVIAALAVLIQQRVPDFAWRYANFWVGLQARLLAYHASLTDSYPPLGRPAHHGAP